MRNSLLLTAVAVVFLFYSCDDDMVVPMDTEETVSVTDYQPSSIGSYWIYERFKAIDDENYESTGFLDTVTLSENVTIAGEVFQRFEGSFFNYIFPEYQRDSLSYIVDSNGHKIFSLSDEVETLATSSEVAFDYTSIMQGETIIDLAIGTRLARYSEGFYDFNPDLITVNCDQTTLNYWVKDVGLARLEYFFSNQCQRYRLELINFHIE